MAFVSGRPAALLLPALAALLLTVGCSPKKYGAVQFHSEPEKAEVLNLRDDALLGLTPVLVVWESDNGEPQYITVQMRKAGYLEEIASFWLNTRYESRESAQEDPQPVTIILKARK